MTFQYFKTLLKPLRLKSVKIAMQTTEGLKTKNQFKYYQKLLCSILFVLNGVERETGAM